MVLVSPTNNEKNEELGASYRHSLSAPRSPVLFFLFEAEELCSTTCEMLLQPHLSCLVLNLCGLRLLTSECALSPESFQALNPKHYL